eukprot:4719101-Prymnesium_polylepis.1
MPARPWTSSAPALVAALAALAAFTSSSSVSVPPEVSEASPCSASRFPPRRRPRRWPLAAP